MLFLLFSSGNNDRNTRIKRGKSAGNGLRATIGSSLTNNTPNKYKATPTSKATTSAETTPRVDKEEKEGSIRVVTVGASQKNGSRRIKLVMSTGSGRIAMTGDVHPEEIPEVTLPEEGVGDVELGAEQEEEQLELVPMTQSILLPDPELVDIYSGETSFGEFSGGQNAFHGHVDKV